LVALDIDCSGFKKYRSAGVGPATRRQDATQGGAGVGRVMCVGWDTTRSELVAAPRSCRSTGEQVVRERLHTGMRFTLQNELV
jgi:hypothetical protein